MASPKSFKFTGRLSKMTNTLLHHAVFLPDEIVKVLPKGRLRTKGTINGIPFALAPQYQKEGGRFFSINASLCKTAKIKAGDKVEITFKLVDPDVVDMPEELEAVLAQDDEAKEVWRSFTKGYQRSLIHYVTSVKNVDSRISRSLELMAKAKTGMLRTQQDKSTKSKETRKKK